MSYSRRAFRGGDEEHGKKYDDPSHPKNKPFDSTAWLQLLPRRPRRVLFAVLGFVLLIVFVHNSSTNLPHASERLDRAPSYVPPDRNTADPPRGPPPRFDGRIPAPGPDHYFNGPIKFYSLAKSLYSTQGKERLQKEDNVVVFAAADLKCVSDLLRLACEMARHKVNRVHFAVMGRDEVPIDGIQKVNGIIEADCPIVWHDGRPDYGPWSTDGRMERSVQAAIGHIGKALRPRVIITHDDTRESLYFWKGITKRAKQMRVTHVVIPDHASHFKWIVKLDANSLEAWDKVQIDILVHALPQSAGGLIRTLKTLQRANYFGAAPILTIELPAEADPSLLKFLSNFHWPPRSGRYDFILRRRMQTNQLTPNEASVRMVDAVHPKNPEFSNVLVISPQAELAPSYYHYLKYTILAYKHSRFSKKVAQRLVGLSLELPPSGPTDGGSFAYPSNLRSYFKADDIPVFLWQAPNSNAALYFGDKWIQFQSFLSKRTLSPSNPTLHPTIMSTKFPAWVRHAVEFIRAHGYYMLFPAFATDEEFALVSVHNELYHPPEEFALAHPELMSDLENTIPRPGEPLSADSDPESGPLQSVEKVLSDSSTISDLLHTFPGGLPNISSLPVVSNAGELMFSDELIEQMGAYQQAFRVEVGSCAEGDPSDDIDPEKAHDLFCYGDGRDRK
ncbi:hypothetical protein VTO42DRAFT_8970 [Malbranchea cinnamomea]